MSSLHVYDDSDGLAGLATTAQHNDEKIGFLSTGFQTIDSLLSQRTSKPEGSRYPRYG